MRLSILILFNFLFLYGFSQAQFGESTFDFGQIKEAAGPVSHTFKFTNTGKDTLRITNVKASCGCTTPKWTREAVAPGASGEILAQYNPLNRPGTFRKSLTVSWQGGSSTSLYITGNVEPKPKTIEDELPVKFGSLRIKYKVLPFGNVTKNALTTREFQVYNDSEGKINWLEEKFQSPDFITIAVDKKSLESKESGILKISLDPTKINDWGFISQEISLFTDEPVLAEKKLSISASLLEYFPPMNAEDKEKTPKLSVFPTTLDFGQIAVDAKAEKILSLQNLGKTDLQIRAIKSNCECISVKYAKDAIAPQGTLDVSLTLDAKGRKGRQYKTLTLFTNDPTNSAQVVSIKAEIK